jgi:hypothetical protein
LLLPSTQDENIVFGGDVSFTSGKAVHLAEDTMKIDFQPTDMVQNSINLADACPQTIAEPITRSVSTLQPPPKRFYRSFWRGLSRRMLEQANVQ